MENLDLFVLVKSCDRYRLPYDFYISRYPVVINEKEEPEIGRGEEALLYRTTWESAVRFCNQLSTKNNLALTYGEESDDFMENVVSAETLLTQPSYRLPTAEEWEFAAHGWSGAKTGDYFPLQKEQFKIPFLDYPTTEEQQRFFEHGYSTMDALTVNPIGIYGLLAYGREWCAPVQNWRNYMGQGVKWEEYYTNYNNDIGYQTTTFNRQNDETLPFRIVLPCPR